MREKLLLSAVSIDEKKTCIRFRSALEKSRNPVPSDHLRVLTSGTSNGILVYLTKPGKPLFLFCQ